MSDFTFEAPECERCGEFLDSPDAECTECTDEELERYHFEHISDDDVVTVWAINGERAWHELVERVEEPLPWNCVETNTMSLDMAQAGVDVKELWESEK